MFFQGWKLAYGQKKTEITFNFIFIGLKRKKRRNSSKRRKEKEISDNNSTMTLKVLKSNIIRVRNEIKKERKKKEAN